MKETMKNILLLTWNSLPSSYPNLVVYQSPEKDLSLYTNFPEKNYLAFDLLYILIS